jgi:hypothetical protein
MQQGARVAICTQVIKLSASVICAPACYRAAIWCRKSKIYLKKVGFRFGPHTHSHTTAHISVVTLSIEMRLVPMFSA